MHRPEPVKCLHRRGVLFREGCLLLLHFVLFITGLATNANYSFFPTTHGNIVCTFS